MAKMQNKHLRHYFLILFHHALLNEQLKDQRKTNIEVVSRLTAVEESTKQAHKRIDELAHKGGQ